MRLLLFDNDDSFTFNLQHLIYKSAGLTPKVINYSELSLISVELYDGFIISPGPKRPSDYPLYKKILELGKPVFGVCLGMQIINCFFGGRVSRLIGCRHGVVIETEYSEQTIKTAVYNSLYCSSIPDCFDVTAVSGRIPMAFIHKERPFCGVQFHPESFMTSNGREVIRDVFRRIGIIR